MHISNDPEAKAVSDDLCVLIPPFFSILIRRHCEPEDLEFIGMIGFCFEIP
jgi:hypothetical protein